VLRVTSIILAECAEIVNARTIAQGLPEIFCQRPRAVLDLTAGAAVPHELFEARISPVSSTTFSAIIDRARQPAQFPITI
jgi:hypothetical protein